MQGIPPANIAIIQSLANIGPLILKFQLGLIEKMKND
jgi:hypothetical protein